MNSCIIENILVEIVRASPLLPPRKTGWIRPRWTGTRFGTTSMFPYLAPDQPRIFRGFHIGDVNCNCNFFDAECKILISGQYQEFCSLLQESCSQLYKCCSQLQISSSISICLFTLNFAVVVWNRFYQFL